MKIESSEFEHGRVYLKQFGAKRVKMFLVCLFLRLANRVDLDQNVRRHRVIWIFSHSAAAVQIDYLLVEKISVLCFTVCSLAKDIGPCEALIPRYYFDTTTGQCQMFSWGGCQPNGNNFETVKDCQNACAN